MENEQYSYQTTNNSVHSIHQSLKIKKGNTQVLNLVLGQAAEEGPQFSLLGAKVEELLLLVHHPLILEIADLA